MNAREIFEQTLQIQAQSLLEASHNLDSAEIDKAVTILSNTRGKVVVSGVGKSGLVGAKIAATLASTGTPSFFAPNRGNAWRFGNVAARRLYACD